MKLLLVATAGVARCDRVLYIRPLLEFAENLVCRVIDPVRATGNLKILHVICRHDVVLERHRTAEQARSIALTRVAAPALRTRHFDGRGFEDRLAFYPLRPCRH